jgi:hypothetical protein
MPLEPLPPKRPSRTAALFERLHPSPSWRVRCDQCRWSFEAATERDANHYFVAHNEDHKRKGIVGQIKMYPLPWWQRFLDWERDHSD